MALNNRASRHRNIHFFALMLLAAGLPLSMFAMSVAQFILLGNWLWEGSLKAKMSGFLRNRVALALTALFAAHLAGLVHTEDFPYAWKDLRIKLPLLLLPLVLSTSLPLPPRRMRLLFFVFAGAVFTATLISLAVFAGFTSREVTDVRDLSVFISHIRFALLLCLALFILGLLFRSERASGWRLAYGLFIAWFICFLVLLESVTGLGILLASGWALIVHHILRGRQATGRASPVTGSWAAYLALAAIPALIFFYVQGEVRSFYAPPDEAADPPEEYTPDGHRYAHDPNNPQVENGHYVWRYIAWDELEAAWSKRSDRDFNGSDKRGNELRFTLIRFLTSKGLRKDGAAMNAMTDREVAAVESGTANVRYMGVGKVGGRIHRILWEMDNYRRGGNPAGHSVALRMEIWRTATRIIYGNPIFGVGTGDVDKDFKAQYDAMQSPLPHQWRLTRSHNQFVSITVALGFAGLAVFLFSLIYPLLKERMYADPYYLVFFITAVLSMLAEDTLETQAGVTFFAFFNSLLLFGRERPGTGLAGL